MSFRLFGVPVSINPFFWIGAVLLGLGDPLRVGLLIALPTWIVAQLVSVIVHEMGHAFVVRRHGVAPEITLHAMGGTCSYPEPAIGRLDRALVSLAGPFAGLLLGGLVLGVQQLVPHEPLPVVLAVFVSDLIWINFAWSLLNLVPVFPFDGGHVMAEIMGPRRDRTAALISLVLSVALAGYFAWTHESWGAILFVMSAMQSYQLYTLPPGAVLVNPLTAARGGARSSGAPSGLRRWWLQLKLKRLQGQADALQGDRAAAPRRRAGGPDLRVIQGGASGPPKDKRYLN